LVTFRGPEFKRLVKWTNPDDAACAAQVDAIDFLEFGNLEESVKDDVKILKDSPLIVVDPSSGNWRGTQKSVRLCNYSNFFPCSILE
jgi:carbonic anhydrase